MEYNDIYDIHRKTTGKVHQRGTAWKTGEYGLIVCVWVYDGKGNFLLTRRAPQKIGGGKWENSGGAAQAGETSRQAIARELFEETGICAQESEFELLDSHLLGNAFFDHYCLHRDIPIEQIILQPSETVDAKWVSAKQIHEMIAEKQVCEEIGKHFLQQEADLLAKQSNNAD